MAMAATAVAACDPSEFEEFSEAVEPAAADPAEGVQGPEDLTLEPGEPSALEPFPPLVTAFSWYKGQPRVKMRKKVSAHCFLSGFSGDFGAVDAARVYIENDSDGESWFLEGTAGLTTATAFCIPSDYASLGTEFTWTQGQAPVDLKEVSFKDGESFKARACYLTAVQGSFDGPGEAVQLEQAGGKWRLTGKGGAGKAVTAKARCLVKDISEHVWVSPNPEWGDFIPNWTTTEQLWKTGQSPAVKTVWPCFLTRFSGAMDSPGNWVRIWYQSNTYVHVLGGFDPTPTPDSLSVGMRCFTSL